MHKSAPIHQMQPNMARIVEAILYLVEDAAEQKQVVTQYDIVKSIFLADRRHLNKYGRPITYDNYVAMLHGPVPTTVYDFLKAQDRIIHRYGKPLPWQRREAPEEGKGCFAFEHPHRSYDQDILSPSDIEELHSALTIVKALGFSQIRKLTHDDQAYIAAWQDNEDRQAYPMSYSLLFDIPNEEQAEEISFLSKHI